MDFTWDPAKAATNLRKHGVTFSEAATAFADPLAAYYRDAVDPSRGILIGLSESARILVTVYVEVQLELVRIISARRANARERKAYEEGD